MQKKRKISYFVFLTLFILSSCNYRLRIKTFPSDAVVFVNGKEVPKDQTYITKEKEINVVCERNGYKDYNKKIRNNIPIFTKKIKAKMEIESYNIAIDTISGISDIFVNSMKIGRTPLEINVKYGIYDMRLSRSGYKDQQYRLEAKRDGKIIYRHQKEEVPIKQVGIFECGSLPKQIIFSPDDNYIFIPLLDGDGFQTFNIDELSMENYIVIPDPNRTKSYPEGAFIEEKKVFWISQMTTGKIYEYTYPGIKYVRSFSTKGKWSKYIAYSSELKVAAVSNWISNDVSIINYENGKVIKKIQTSAAPRGLIFSKDGKYLYVTSFDGGKAHKYETQNWEEKKSIHIENAAMRHIVLTEDNSKAYLSDMYHNKVYEIDTNEFVITHSFEVDSNPNTISLTSDNNWLFVSSRGPNSIETYLTRSPRSGKIAIIDTKKREVISFFEGGNQPTGLGISNDGNYLSFSNFRDNNIELYWIGDLKDE